MLQVVIATVPVVVVDELNGGDAGRESVARGPRAGRITGRAGNQGIIDE